MDYNLFKVFCVVAEEKNITRASEKLYISQPAVSYSIKKLEDYLKTNLFSRSKKGVELTREGNLIYEQVVSLIDSLDSIQEYCLRLKKLELGDLKIGSNTSNINIAIMSYIKKLKDDYKNVNISFIRESTENIKNMLKNNLLDIAVINYREDHNYDDLIVIKEIAIEEHLVCSKELYEQYKDITIDKNNLKDIPLILLTKNSTTRKNFDLFLEKNNLNIHPLYEFDSYSLAVDFIKNGFGIGIVNEKYIENDLNNKNLFILNDDLDLEKRRLLIVTANNTIQSNVTKKFIDIIHDL